MYSNFKSKINFEMIKSILITFILFVIITLIILYVTHGCKQLHDGDHNEIIFCGRIKYV